MPELLPDLLCPFCMATVAEELVMGHRYVRHPRGVGCLLDGHASPRERWNTRPPHPDTVRLEKLAGATRPGRAIRGWKEVTVQYVELSIEADSPTLEAIRHHLDALHGPTEEV